MPFIKRILNSPYFFWALLCLPAAYMSYSLYNNGAKAIGWQVHPSGEFSARFMIISLAITPLCLLLPSWRGPRWLMKRRRYLGVAAFGYALIHTVCYLIDKNDLGKIIGEALMASIWTGWLAFMIFIPLAVTSTDGWVRRLGPAWKKLQRWVYAAAVLTLAHWLLIAHGPMGAIVHFTPIALLEAYRIHWNMRRRTAAA